MKVALLLLITSSLALAKDKTPAGEILAPGALAKVGSFCVDTAGLSDFDYRLVKDFVKAESKPKHLLTKLPWKLVPECQTGASDASVKLKFEPIDVIRVTLPQGAPDGSRERPTAIRVVLQVADTNSGDQLYQGESRAVMPKVGLADGDSTRPEGDTTSRIMEERDALYHVFWGLVEDVRRLKSG